MTEHDDRWLDDHNESPRRRAWQKRITDSVTRALLEQDQRYFFSQALSTPCLNAVSHAAGIYIDDVAGRRYMDFHGNSVHHIGYAHPRLIEALRGQLGGLTFSPRRYTNEHAVALARALASIAPGNLSKCLFTPSGNDAMEVALRLARGVTGRHKTIAFWGAFHGAGLAASSVGGEAMFRSGPAGPLLPGANHVPPPLCYRCPYGHERGQGCCMMAAQMIRYVLKQEGDVAAVVAAPVQGAEYVPPPDFWGEVRNACDEHGSLLIFDEIQTGLGKTGRMFACEHYGVVPDILVLGKALGGGVVPLAAVLARDDFDLLGDVAIGHFTHEKNPLMAVAGLTTLAIIEEEGLVQRAADRGREALELAQGLAERHPLVGDVRGLGLQLGIELVEDRASKEPARDAAEEVLYSALDRGLSLKISNGCILALNPPLVISAAELARALSIIEECLTLVEERNSS
jgi:4-aminobutyrate aminotransferase